MGGQPPQISMLMIRRWGFSIVLLGAYLAVFHSWMHLGPEAVIASGLTTALLLAGVMVYVARTGYFANRWDAFGHTSVIIDIALESFIRLHDGLGFYLCAAGFALVIGLYRRMLLRRGGFSASLQPVTVAAENGSAGSVSKT